MTAARNRNAMMRRAQKAFTLAELLVALGILGVIATFTIPKVLVAQQGSAWRATAKEVAAMVSGAYVAFKMRSTPNQSTLFSELTPYMNYVTDTPNGSTSMSIDNVTGDSSGSPAGSLTCVPPPGIYRCLRLANGGILRYRTAMSFDGTDTTNAMQFEFDPDGTFSGTTNGPGKSVSFYLYFNGNIRTIGTILDNTAHSYSAGDNPDPTKDPTWFAWN